MSQRSKLPPTSSFCILQLPQRDNLRLQLSGDLLKLLALLRLYLLQMFHGRLLVGWRFALCLAQFCLRLGYLTLKFLRGGGEFFQRGLPQNFRSLINRQGSVIGQRVFDVFNGRRGDGHWLFHKRPHG